MALSWRRGPHLQPTPPSVSSVLLAPSLPLSLFKPPPVRDLYDPDALLGVQDLPCSCTPSCLSVTCCLSLSCILCIPARLGQYPVISCLFLCHNVASCWMPTPPTPRFTSPLAKLSLFVVRLKCRLLQESSALLWGPLLGLLLQGRCFTVSHSPRSVPLISLPLTVCVPRSLPASQVLALWVSQVCVEFFITIFLPSTGFSSQ